MKKYYFIHEIKYRYNMLNFILEMGSSVFDLYD